MVTDFERVTLLLPLSIHFTDKYHQNALLMDSSKASRTEMVLNVDGRSTPREQ